MLIIDINDNQREAKSIVPDPNYPGFLKVEFLKRFDWYSVKEFLEKNPALAYLVKQVRAIPEDTLGVVTTATETTLRDTKQNLKENAYVGFIVWISRGLGEGQKRLITGNTANSITIDTAWEIQPDSTSQYVLSHNIHDVSPHGNTLPAVDQAKLEKESKKIDRLLRKKKAPTKQKTKVVKKTVKKTVKKAVKSVRKVAIQKKKSIVKKHKIVQKKRIKKVAPARNKKVVKNQNRKTNPTKARKVQTKIVKPNKKKVVKKVSKSKKKK